MEKTKDEIKYTKEEIKNSDKFKRFKDAVEVLLEDEKYYTVGEAEEIIEKFMKGRV